MSDVLRRAARVASVVLASAALPAPAAAETAAPSFDEARKASAELVASVRGELLKALDDSGPLRASVVCRYTASEIASALSRKHGARLTRVTLAPRNPALGWADAWEQRVLMDFDERVARGERADTLEHAEVVNEPSGPFVRYLKALPMQPVCMQCHGPARDLSDAIRHQLAHDYPHDRAAGLTLGRIRGAVSFKKPL